MKIPAKDSSEALAIVERHFTDGLLHVLGQTPGSPALERRLYRLCRTLAERYFVGVTFACEPGATVMIDYVVDDLLPDVDLNYETRSTRKSRLRLALGAAPTPICFHAPLARITPSYDVRLRTLPTAYVHNQVFLERVKSEASVTSYRNIPERTETRVRTWRGPAGTSTAHSFLANGHQTAQRVYVGMKVFERLPGSAGRTAFIAMGALATCTLLAIGRWVSGAGVAGNAGALVVAALGLITFGADVFATSDADAYVSLTSRVN